MTTMTLTAKSYADLEPIEALARQYSGVSVSVERREPYDRAALKRFNMMCKEARRYAKEVGLTPDDVTAAIKRVRAKERTETEANQYACSN